MNPKVDGPCSWIGVISGFLLHAMILGLPYSFGIFYVAILQEFPGTESETAWISSMMMGILMLLTPLTIRLCGRLSPRIVCCSGTLLASLALYLASIAPNIPTLCLTFGFMYGISLSFCYVAILMVLRANFKKYLDLAFGINSAGTGVGGVVFGLLLPSIVETRGWRGALKLLSCIILCFIVCCLVLVPAEVKKTTALRQVSKQEESKPEKKSTKIPPLSSRESSLKRLLTKMRLKGIRLSIPRPWYNKAFIVLSFSIVLALFVSPIPYCHIVNYGINQGLGRSDAERLPLFMSVGSTIGRISIGRISDFAGVNRITLSQITFLVLSLASTLCTMATSTAWLILFACVFGAFDGFVNVMCAMVVDNVFYDKKQAMQAFGNLFVLCSIPITLGSPVAGWLYTVTGSYHTIFFCSGAILFLASCLISIVRYLLPSPDSAATIPGKVVVSSASCSYPDLTETKLSNLSSSRLMSTGMCSLVDLSVELFSESSSYPCECSKDFSLAPLPRFYPSKFPEHTKRYGYGSEHTILGKSLSNECNYTDITEQISGWTEKWTHVDVACDEREKHFPHVVSDEMVLYDDVTSLDCVDVTSDDHVFGVRFSNDTGSAVDPAECFGVCADVIAEDQGYISAAATANTEDSDVQSHSSQTDSDSLYSSLDGSVCNFVYESTEDKKTLTAKDITGIPYDENLSCKLYITRDS